MKMFKCLLTLFLAIMLTPSVFGETKEISIKEIKILSQRGTMLLFPSTIEANSGGCPENTGNPYYFTGDVPTNTYDLTRLPMKNEMAFSIAMAAYLNDEKVTLSYSVQLSNRCVVDSISVIKK